VATASIHSQKVGEECWNSGLDGRPETMAASIHLKVVVASIHLEAAAATSEAARLRETLPTASQMVDPHENPTTLKFDLLMSKNLNSQLKKEESYTCDPSKCGVEGSTGVLGHGPYGKRYADCINYINHLLLN
jgi:hypothetical protein